MGVTGSGIVPVALHFDSIKDIPEVAMAVLYAFLSSLSMWQIAAVFGACYALVAIAAIPLRHRLVGHDETSHHEALDAIFGAVSSLYAILLGLILVAAWQNFEEAEHEQIDESHHIVTLFRLSAGMGEAVGGQIRSDLYRYTKLTVEEEWPEMDTLFEETSGQSTGLPEILAVLNALWSRYSGYQSPDLRAQMVWNQSMDELIALTQDRRSRLLDAKPHLPPDVWRLLFAGAALVMVMAALFTVGRRGLFAVTSFALGASIALELAVVISVDHPYAGQTVVEPNALSNAIVVMEHLSRTDPATYRIASRP